MRQRLALCAAIALATAGLAACAGRPIPVATDADAARVAAQWPGTTAADLNHGRQLLLAKCGNCHQPPAPTAHVAADWPAEVQEMRERSGLSVSDAALVERYLTAFAADAVATAPR